MKILKILRGNKNRKVRRLLKNGYSLYGNQLVRLKVEPIDCSFEPVYMAPMTSPPVINYSK